MSERLKEAGRLLSAQQRLLDKAVTAGHPDTIAAARAQLADRARDAGKAADALAECRQQGAETQMRNVDKLLEQAVQVLDTGIRATTDLFGRAMRRPEA